MNTIDSLSLVVLFIFILIYLYILIKNNMIFNPNKIVGLKTILDKSTSISFEIFEIIILFIIPVILYLQKQYILALVFTIQFIEHISQIIFCYRQTIISLQVVTMCIDLFFGIYAYYTKCYWVIPIFIIGIIIHIVSLYYNKSFTDIVCIVNVKE